MDVPVRAKHVAEDGPAGDDVLTVRDRDDEVVVLKLPVLLRLHLDGRVVDQLRLAGDDRVDRCTARCVDVDAVVEQKRSRSLQTVGQHRVQKARPGIPEVGPDGVLLVEGLHRPRVSSRCRGREERDPETEAGDEKAKAHG